MSHAEFAAWLMKIGMGWLGWTERQTLDTSIPAVLFAYEGRKDMLRAVFGSGEPDPPKDKLTAKVNDAKAMQKVFDAIG